MEWNGMEVLSRWPARGRTLRGALKARSATSPNTTQNLTWDCATHLRSQQHVATRPALHISKISNFPHFQTSRFENIQIPFEFQYFPYYPDFQRFRFELLKDQNEFQIFKSKSLKIWKIWKTYEILKILEFRVNLQIFKVFWIFIFSWFLRFRFENLETLTEVQDFSYS